jgi:hypothetical protein
MPLHNNSADGCRPFMKFIQLPAPLKKFSFKFVGCLLLALAKCYVACFVMLGRTGTLFYRASDKDVFFFFFPAEIYR